MEHENYEFNSAAMFALWHEPSRRCRDQITWPAYDDGRKRENSSV